MKFNKLIEDFNIFTNSQNAIQSGPDIGMTSGDIEGTFPNRKGSISGKILPDNTVHITLNKISVKKIIKLLSSVL